MPIPFIKTASGSITAFVNGRNLQVPSDHRYYNEILNAIRTDNAEEFAKLADLSESLTRFIHKNSAGEEIIKVEDGLVYYRGSEIHNSVTERILDFMKQNLPVEPLILFLENLLLNPSRHSVQQLHRFLENQKLPITEDGCFLAYKRVNANWRDFRTDKIDNSIGAEPFMIRNEVDDDFSHDCSYGLHVGSIGYVRNFESSSPGNHLIVVKVNPQDAVSVPQYDSTKMRVCKYKVIEEASPESLGLSEALYSATTSVNPIAGSPVPSSPPVDEEFETDEDQWDEEEDEEDEEEEENDDDAEGDWDADEENDEVESSDVPLSIRVWAESKNIELDYFGEDWSSSYSKHLAKALAEKDGVSALQYLYAIAIEEDDTDVQQVLENPEDKRDFIDLVKSL